MRRRHLMLPLMAALAVVVVAASRAPAFPAPKQANVVAACTPGGKPHVDPPLITMKRADHVVWGSTSPGATSWTITPKDTLDWPWSERSFTGTAKTPATTPTPLASAKENHRYHYRVQIACSGGTTQIIDPDVIIGGSQ